MKPPGLAIWLLETLLPEESREAVIGDLVEQYERGEIGRLQLWKETFAALPQLQFLPFGATSFTPFTRETLMQSFLTDVRYAARVLWRSRGFTMACAATLAIAIAATTVIYSVVNPVLIESLPYPSPERLVLVSEIEADGPSSATGWATYADIRDRSGAFEATAAIASWNATFIGTADAETAIGASVSWPYFRTLGVRPLIGRDFTAEDDVVGGPQRVILSHGLWARRFGGDRGIIGRDIDIGGIQRTVVGVMPASFEDVLNPGAQAWRVLRYGPTAQIACRTCRHLKFVARLKPGVARERAEREVDAIVKQLATETPNAYAGANAGALVRGLQERIASNSRPVLLAVLGAVALLLLIAIANVTNLQLARAMRREEEFAVRAALGAGRTRIARQLFAEGLVLATIGGVAGVTLAALSLPLVVSRLPDSLPRLHAVGIDMSVLAIVLAIVLLVAISMGLTPALRAGSRRIFDTLRGSRAVGLTHHRLRAAIVVGEVAVAMLLLAGAGLLGRSMMRLLDVDVGFDGTSVVTMPVMSVGARYATDTIGVTRWGMQDRVRAAVRAVPGVVDVGLTSQLPLSGYRDSYGLMALDKPVANAALLPTADRYTVSWDFLRTMKISVIRGRAFTEAEANDTANLVMLVSEGLARRYWPGEDPIGKQIGFGGPNPVWYTVLGMTKDIRHHGIDVASSQIYFPQRQWYAEGEVQLVARVRGDPARMTAAVREAVRGVDPLQPIAIASTMDQVVARSTSQRRLGLLLFVAFGAIALLLATAGIYGVLAGSVTERTREFGVRTALGATPRDIAAMVVRQGVGLAALGLALGVGAALALSRYLRALLFGIEPSDPVALTGGAVAIAIVALLACLVPARRATRVDPMQALRE